MYINDKETMKCKEIIFFKLIFLTLIQWKTKIEGKLSSLRCLKREYGCTKLVPQNLEKVIILSEDKKKYHAIIKNRFLKFSTLDEAVVSLVVPATRSTHATTRTSSKHSWAPGTARASGTTWATKVTSEWTSGTIVEIIFSCLFD